MSRTSLVPAVIVAIVFAAAAAAAAAAECPAELETGCSCTTLNSKCYCVCTLLKNWTDAAAYCQSQEFALVSLEDAVENYDVAEYMLRMGYSRGVPFFTSGRRDSSQDPWIWTSTQEVISFTNWIPGFGGGPGCIVLSLPDDGMWFPADCKSNYYFVCERSITF